MHLIPHIYQYLQLHKKVAISGLGVFYLKRVNSFLDEDSKTVFPPSLKVKFDDTEVSNNDFAQHISNQSQIELEKVIYYVEKLVRDIRKVVESGSVYILENIGSLELNRGGIRLINADSTIYNQDFYGLKPQTYSSIKLESSIQPLIIEEIEVASEVEQSDQDFSTPLSIQPLIVEEIEFASEVEQSQQDISTTISTQPSIEEEIIGDVEQLQQDFPTSYTLAEQALNASYVHESEVQPKRKFSWLWISIMVLIAVAILGAIGYYFYALNSSPVKKIKENLKGVVKIGAFQFTKLASAEAEQRTSTSILFQSIPTNH